MNSIHDQQIKQRDYAAAQSSQGHSVLGGGLMSAVPSPARVPEVEYELDRLSDALSYANRLYADLHSKLTSVRADGEGANKADSGPVEAQAATPLGQRIRSLRYSVDSLTHGLQYQLATVELTSA